MAGGGPSPGSGEGHLRPDDPREIVRRGYDAVSYRYRADDASEDQYQPWLTQLAERVRDNGTVLDLGCGCGVPVARSLAASRYAVTGIDLSEVQIQRARTLVPDATFILADATTVSFPDGSFDAVVSVYTFIHLPLDEQPGLLARIARWLRAGGWFAATVGHESWTGTEDNWLGSGTPMWWSHADAATYRRWITRAGLTVQAETFVPEGAGGHTLFWARKPLA